jgi:predicted nuclease with RNAse H fold
MVLGVDVGARLLHTVALTDEFHLETRVFSAGDLDSAVAWAGGAAAVAIDSPDSWSTAPHASDLTLPPKFRTARCAEIGLGRRFGVWVSWTTPADPVDGSWMDVGIRLFAALRTAGHSPLEVYPFGAFRTLAANRPLPKKQTPAGRHARAALLEAAGVAMPDTSSHDCLDAAAAALVALHHLGGRATRATCGHDGTAIWLPAALPAGVAESAASLGGG